MSRVGILLAFVLFVQGCRDIQPFEPYSRSDGFGLEGTVTAPNGIPLDSVSVRLFYSTTLTGRTPIDSTQLMISDPPRIIVVDVFDVHSKYVAQVFSGYKPPGPMPRFNWDERDAEGKYVPSGKYFIQYVYDTAVVKIITWLVEGTVTAISNADGKFTIASDRLPIGERFDFYRFNGEYDGTYRVLPEIILTLFRGGRFATYRVDLQRESVTHGVFVLE